MKQPTKFVLYAVVNTFDSAAILAVALTRQAAKQEAEKLRAVNPSGFLYNYKVRRAKGVLFDT